MVFSLWKAMIGSAIVTLPWAFQQSGVCIGSLITFTSFVVSYYTCTLVVKTSKKEENFAEACKKQFGKCKSNRKLISAY